MKEYYIRLDLNNHNQKAVRYLCNQVIKSIVRSNNYDTIIESINEGYDITEDELDDYLTSQLERFQHIYDNPNELLSLAQADLSMFKHFLTTYCYEVKKWKEGWIKLWTIFEYQELIEENLN